MIPQGSGCVINLSSAAGKRGRANLTAYCAAKHAVIGITRAAAIELAPHGIRVDGGMVMLEASRSTGHWHSCGAA